MADYYPVSNATILALTQNEINTGNSKNSEFSNWIDPTGTYATTLATTQQMWLSNANYMNTHLQIQQLPTS